MQRTELLQREASKVEELRLLIQSMEKERAKIMIRMRMYEEENTKLMNES